MAMSNGGELKSKREYKGWYRTGVLEQNHLSREESECGLQQHFTADVSSHSAIAIAGPQINLPQSSRS